MGNIPDGIQRHVLITMDGRTWIENINAANPESPTYKRMKERGNLIEIPHDKLVLFVADVRKGE